MKGGTKKEESTNKVVIRGKDYSAIKSMLLESLQITHDLIDVLDNKSNKSEVVKWIDATNHIDFTCDDELKGMILKELDEYNEWAVENERPIQDIVELLRSMVIIQINERRRTREGGGDSFCLADKEVIKGVIKAREDCKKKGGDRYSNRETMTMILRKFLIKQGYMDG